MAHITLLMVSAFSTQLARLKVASLALVPVAKRRLICLGSHTKLYVPGISQQPTPYYLCMFIVISEASEAST